MNASPKIVFFGNERLSTGFDPHGAPTLQALINAGYHVAAVVANFEQGRGRKPRELEIKTVADAHNIPLLLPDKPKDIVSDLQALGATIGVLVAYGKMVPQAVIDIFPRGIVNIHPSLLPKYRGSTPVEQAILDGIPETGVSLMGLVKAMDAGPVYAQTRLPLTGIETKQNLTATLLRKGGELLLQQLPALLAGTAAAQTQDESQATYTTLLTKQDSVLDLSKPAAVLERRVRALATWPKSRVTIFGQEIIVQQARVVPEQNDTALILPCADHTFLEITQLTAPSGRTMNGVDFMRGYKK